jgi:hypothetical protein
VSHVVGAPGEPGVALDARLLLEEGDRVLEERDLFGLAGRVVAREFGQPQRQVEAAQVGFDVVDEPLGVVLAGGLQPT